MKRILAMVYGIKQAENQKAKLVAPYAVITLLMLVFSTYGSAIFAAGEVGRELPVRVPSVLEEKIAFPSEDRELTGGKPTMLQGYLFRPDGPGPFPAIVGLHGCGGIFTSGRMNARFADWGRRLSALGYIVLFPDSFSPRGISEVCTQKDRRGFSAYRERVRDADGALHWLQRQTTVQGDRIGLMGWSNGGSTLLATIGALAKKNGHDGFRIAIAFYPGCTHFMKNKHWQPRLPLTIFIGEADDWTPAAPCKSLVARANAQGCQAEIHTFANASHDFDHPNLAMKTRKALAFTVDDQGSAKVGTDPEGRAAVLELVPDLLARYLIRPPNDETLQKNIKE